MNKITFFYLKKKALLTDIGWNKIFLRLNPSWVKYIPYLIKLPKIKTSRDNNIISVKQNYKHDF